MNWMLTSGSARLSQSGWVSEVTNLSFINVSDLKKTNEILDISPISEGTLSLHWQGWSLTQLSHRCNIRFATFAFDGSVFLSEGKSQTEDWKGRLGSINATVLKINLRLKILSYHILMIHRHLLRGWFIYHQASMIPTSREHRNIVQLCTKAGD